ncbi:MAG: hypothetical protein ABIS67_14440 [Candidatus Eisenbacteria bacterium]
MAVTALVVLGAAAGITADRLFYRRPHVHPVRLSDGTVIRLSDLQADPMGTIDRAVGLRPEQRSRVAAIIARRQSHFDATWHEARIRIQGTIDSLMTEIAAELDPDQAKRFRALHDELHGPRHSERPLPH